MGILWQEYWSGLPYPPAGDFPNPGIEAGSPALQVDSLPTELSGKPITIQSYIANCVSWVLRLTLLDLEMNWTYECALGRKLDHM